MMAQSRNKILVILITLAAIAAIAVGLHFKSDLAPVTSAKEFPKAITINTQQQPTMGSTSAPLHIVAFEDLKCGNCKNYNDNLFPKIKARYLDTQQARYTTILLAFIDGSIPAANAALCLNEQSPNYFFPYIDYLYQNQPPETEDWATLPNLLIAASKATPKANRDALSQCVFGNTYTNVVQHNFDIAKHVMGDQIATPSVYINGVLVRPLTMEQIDKVASAVR